MNLSDNARIPLSKRMMPETLDEFVGQKHLVSEGKPVRTMLENKLIHSMIFYGPPATGKTSLAEILTRTLGYDFINASALNMDSDDIRKYLKRAENNRKDGRETVLFIDEIHRLYKPKQDAFLAAIENGLIHIIGATTENPYFLIQPALRSRLFIYEFKTLNKKARETILQRALDNDDLLVKLETSLDDNAREALFNVGDPRMMLNTLEMAVLSKGPGKSSVISADDIENILQKKDTRYSDKEGHYDVISAFIKSVRGSDPDAAIYYLALMLESGEDPLFIARRLIILAGEDIGLAYPEGLGVAVSTYQAVERIGMPEGIYPLANTTLLLAGVPKSNSAKTAIKKAQNDVKNGKILPVPPYLREASFYGAENLGRGKGYKYPHDFPRHYIDQNYTSEPVSYYTAGNLGFEKKIKEWMEILKSK